MWFHGERTPRDLTVTFANFTVVSESYKASKTSISIFVVAGEVLNGMTYIGATPALYLGAKATKFGPQFGYTGTPWVPAGLASMSSL